MRLLMSQKMRPAATLNIRVSEQVCTGLVVLGCLALLGWLWTGAEKWFAVAAGALAGTVAINGPLFAWLARQRGWGFALGAIPLRLLSYVLNAVSVSLALLPFGLGQEQTSAPSQKWSEPTNPLTSAEPVPSTIHRPEA